MKPLKFHYLYLFIIITNSLFAQQEDEKNRNLDYTRHEIRLVFENFSIGEPKENYSYINIDNLINGKFLYGLGYNFNFKSFSIRSKFFYSKSSEVKNNGIFTHFLRTTVGVNYQKRYTKRYTKLVFITGFDFGYFNCSCDDYFQTNVKGFSIEPLIGMNYFISKHFSINPELRIVVGKYDISSSFYVWQPYGSPFLSNKESKENFYTKVLGSLSLNFNF